MRSREMESAGKVGNITIRPITMDDTELIVRWRANPRVMNNFIYRETLTAEVHKKWMETKVAAGEVLQFIISECSEKGERPIGSVYLRDVNLKEGTAEYGIFIGEDDATGKGYGTLAAGWAVEYAAGIGLKCLILRVFADNRPAIASYERAGFIPGERVEKFMDGRDLLFMKKELSE